MGQPNEDNSKVAGFFVKKKKKKMYFLLRSVSEHTTRPILNHWCLKWKPRNTRSDGEGGAAAELR